MSAEEDYYKQTKAIDDVYKGLEEDDLQKAIAASKNSSTRKKTPPKNVDPLNRFKKKEETPANNTRRNKLQKYIDEGNELSNMYQIEKQTLESKLPVYLNGAKVDIIERDGHCFFRSLTHQLRAYGFKVPDEYQTVRNLVADYIEKTQDITLDMIMNESPEYDTKEKYVNALRKELWGGKIEINAIHEGCLGTLTNSEPLRINIYSVNNGKIELDPNFIFTRPHGEEEQFMRRLPIRLLYVGKNHFHRIYFDDKYYQKLDYQNEVRTDDFRSEQLMPKLQATQINDPLSQWPCSECTYLNDDVETNCQLCGTDKNVKKEIVSIYKHNIVQNVEVFGYVNGAGINYEQYNNNKNDAHEIKITPEIRQMFETINAANTDNINSENHTDYKQEIGLSHLINLDDLGQWTEESQKVVAFVPKDEKRPPPATVKNQDNSNKTFINVFIHDWVCFGTEPDESNTITKYPFLKLEDSKGIEETVGNNIDIYPVTREWTQLEYQIHNLDDNPASYSPDTGIIVLDDNFDGNPFCKITCVDVLTKRILRVELTFFRDDINTYKNHIYSKIGGKPRRTRKSRKHRRRQTKRRR